MKEKNNDYEQLLIADAWVNEQEEQTTDSAEFAYYNSGYEDEYFYINWKDDTKYFHNMWDDFVEKYGCEPDYGDWPDLDDLWFALVWYSDYQRTIIDEQENYYFNALNYYIDEWVLVMENRTTDSPDYMV